MSKFSMDKFEEEKKTNFNYQVYRIREKYKPFYHPIDVMIG